MNNQVNLQSVRDLLKRLIISDFLVELLEVVSVCLLHVLEGRLHALQQRLHVIVGLLAELLDAGFQVVQVLLQSTLGTHSTL